MSLFFTLSGQLVYNLDKCIILSKENEKEFNGI